MSETNRPGVEGLADLVSTRMIVLGDERGPLSLRNVVQRSGDRLSPETLRRIARGEHQGNISDRVAEGLAVALEIPIGRIYEAAGLPQPKRRWEWPAVFDRLSIAERTVVEDVARGFLQAYERGRRDATKQKDVSRGKSAGPTGESRNPGGAERPLVS